MTKTDSYTKAITIIVIGVSIVMILYTIWLVSGIGGDSSSSSVPIAVLIPSFSAIFITLIAVARRKKEEEIRCHQKEE
jgi:hypothetical protein